MEITFLFLCLTLATEIKNIFPNKSSVKVFRDMKTNKISWEDESNLVRNEKKEQIEYSLQQKGKTRSNCLFDCISNWYFVTGELIPFLKELMDPISEDVDLDKREVKHNGTPLQLAARFGAAAAVVKLIERGAQAEVIDEEGWTALHYASINGNKSCCKVLLEKAANLNAQSKDGCTPLIRAATMGRVEVVKFLLQWGAATKIKDNNGNTALCWAILQENENCAEVIRAHETKKTVIRKDVKPDEDGWGALHQAAANGNELDCEYLLEKGANVDVQDKHGYTGLIIAAAYGYVEVVKILLKFKANAKITDAHGSTALRYARPNCFDIIRAHEERNRKLWEKPSCSVSYNKAADGWTSVHYAAANGDQSWCRGLLQKGENANVQDKEGNSPLIIATMFGHVEIVKLLLEFGADRDMKDKHGSTALAYAKRGCADVLRRWPKKDQSVFN